MKRKIQYETQMCANNEGSARQKCKKDGIFYSDKVCGCVGLCEFVCENSYTSAGPGRWSQCFKPITAFKLVKL